MKQTPILFISDSPDIRSGLARISRDLACLTASLPEYRVGILGRGGLGTRQIPIAQYVYDVKHGFGDETLIERVWSDFADDGEGIIFAIWDATRLGWLSRGEWIRKRRGKVKLVIYAPVDSHGIGNRLTNTERNVLEGFDTVLAYGKFGADVLSNTLGRPIDWIPHGMNLDVFQPRDRTAARIALGIDAKQKLVGCVMTNQARKDFGILFHALSMIPDWHLWLHVDTIERHWNIGELISSYGMESRTTISFSGTKDDTAMSYYFSACDVTVLPSTEGFGFPIAESLACGVPVVHSTYGGGNWGIEGVLSVQPIAMHVEGVWNTMRPVFDPAHWAEAIDRWAGVLMPEQCRGGVLHLSWANLWPGCWKKFMLRIAE